MAIINPKRREAFEEAERQARARAEEYAQRYDTSASSSAGIAPSSADTRSAQDRASAAATGHRSGIHTVDDQLWMQPPPAYEDTRANARRSAEQLQDHSVNEGSPLLPTARNNASKSNRLPRSLQRRSSKCAFLLVIALLVIIMTTTFRDDRHERGEVGQDVPSDLQTCLLTSPNLSISS